MAGLLFRGQAIQKTWLTNPHLSAAISDSELIMALILASDRGRAVPLAPFHYAHEQAFQPCLAGVFQ